MPVLPALIIIFGRKPPFGSSLGLRSRASENEIRWILRSARQIKRRIRDETALLRTVHRFEAHVDSII